jgi:hypothetical protein
MSQSTFTAHHVERLVRHYRQIKRNEALDQENVSAGTFFHCALRWPSSNYGRPIAINGRSGH